MDLFEDEQQIYDHAASHIKAVDAGAPYDFTEFRKLTKEYKVMLKLLRRMTKLSDRTTDGLNESNLDLADKVHCDALTGIYNRRFLEESLDNSIRSLSCSGGVMSVMMMDLDFFKKFNDTYGHGAGDKCLRAVAKALADSAACSGDFVARYGGEEFVAVLQNMDEAGLSVMSENILGAIRRLEILHEKNEAAGYVTISIGAMTVKPKCGHKFADYLNRVDIALYASKQNGRNCYTCIEYEEDRK